MARGPCVVSMSARAQGRLRAQAALAVDCVMYGDGLLERVARGKAAEGPDACMSVGGVVTHVTVSHVGVTVTVLSTLILYWLQRTGAKPTVRVWPGGIMSGSQPGGHELFGLCTSRVAFHVLSYPASSWAVPSDGGCTITLAAHTSCVAHSEPEQNRAFACSQKLPRPTYSRKHGARLRSLRSELLVAAVL